MSRTNQMRDNMRARRITTRITKPFLASDTFDDAASVMNATIAKCEDECSPSSNKSTYLHACGGNSLFAVYSKPSSSSMASSGTSSKASRCAWVFKSVSWSEDASELDKLELSLSSRALVPKDMDSMESLSWCCWSAKDPRVV